MQRLRPDDPETIGRYTLVARLGAGGMGVVFLATAGSQSVALKVVRTSYLDNAHLHSRFVREIETLKKIDSPYVAKIFDYAVEEDTAWHAVEFVSGPTLKQKVETDGPLHSGEWDKLARELQAGLDDIHRLGIVHRDLKPANMVMGDSGVKLIDFGIAQDDDATSMTMTGLVAGSPAWMSPERLEGEGDSRASDLFSAGSVLTFAATGKSPWGASDKSTVSTMLTRIIGGTPNLEGLTPDQEQVVRGLLNPDPGRRSWLNRELPVQTEVKMSTGPLEPGAVTSSPPLADCGCSRWERGWGNTEYRNGRTYCLRCRGVVWPTNTPVVPTTWRVFSNGLRPSFLIIVAAITGTNFLYISPLAVAGTLFFLSGVVVAVVFLVRSLMRLQRESTGPYLGLKLLLAVVSWIALTMAVFVLEIYLFDWLYWRI